MFALDCLRKLFWVGVLGENIVDELYPCVLSVSVCETIAVLLNLLVKSAGGLIYTTYS